MIGLKKAPLLQKRRITNPRASVTLQLIGDIHTGSISSSRLDAITNDQPIVPFAHVQSGDQTETAHVAQDAIAITFLDGLPSTWYAVCGNHDIYNDLRTPAEWAADYGMDGKNYVVDLGFAVLIALGPDDYSSVRELASATISYLDTQLGAAGKDCIITAHYPPYNSALSPDVALYYQTLDSDWFVDDWLQIFDVLASNDNAIAWVCGHTHSPIFAENFVKKVQVGTHYMTFINCSSPHYTDRISLEANSPEIPTNYLSVFGNRLEVRVRDHAKTEWVDIYRMPIKTGLGEVTEYLVDEFRTNASAPLPVIDSTTKTGVRTCEPGPGGLDLLDTYSVMSISNNQLTFNGTPAAGGNDGWHVQDVVLRSTGNALLYDMPARTTVSSGYHYVGLASTRNDSTVVDIGYSLNSTTAIDPVSGADSLDISFTIGSNSWSFIHAMRSSGGLLLGRDSGDTADEYKILMVYSEGTEGKYAKMRLGNSAIDFTMDNFKVYRLTGDFSTDFGFASDYEATTSNGDTTLTVAKDGWLEHTITAQTGVTQEMMFRRTDDDNTWIVRMDQGGSTLKLITKTGGGETERDSDAYTWTNNETYRVLIYFNGDTVYAFVNDKYVSKADVSFQNTVIGVKVSHAGVDWAYWPLAVTVTL